MAANNMTKTRSNRFQNTADNLYLHSAALLTQHYPAGSWLPVLRPYTPISDPDTVGKLQLLVKRYAKGKASSHIHNLAVGDSLTVRGPLPGYAWAPSSEERGVIFVAGGAGITPLFSLLKDALANSDDKSMIELLWGVRTKQDITLRKELTELQIRNPKRFRVTYAISRPGDGDPDPQEPDEQITHVTGRVGSQLLQKSVDRFGSYKQLGDGKGTKVFLCGPPGMEAAMMSRDGILKELGFANKDIHKF